MLLLLLLLLLLSSLPPPPPPPRQCQHLMATPFRFLPLPSSVLALTSFTTKTIQQQKCDPRATLSTTNTSPTIYRELVKKKPQQTVKTTCSVVQEEEDDAHECKHQ
jgi:hypothetical protein